MIEGAAITDITVFPKSPMDDCKCVPKNLTAAQRVVLADAFGMASQGRCILFDDLWEQLLAAGDKP